MGHFPYKMNFRIYTKKTPAEVYEILKEETAVWGMGHVPLGEGVFVGEVGASYFKVVPRPSLSRRYHSAAVAEGTIKAEAGETVVDVKMRPPWQVYLSFPATFLFAVGFLYLEMTPPPIVCKVFLVFICLSEIGAWFYGRSEFHYDADRVRWAMEKLLGESVDIDG